MKQTVCKCFDAQVIAAAEVAAVPLWLKVLVSPLALVLLTWRGLGWLLIDALPLAIGYGVAGVSRAVSCLDFLGAAIFDFLLVPCFNAMKLINKRLLLPTVQGLGLAGEAVYARALSPAASGMRAAVKWALDTMVQPSAKAMSVAASLVWDRALVPSGRAAASAAAHAGSAISSAASLTRDRVLVPVGNGAAAGLRWALEHLIAPSARGCVKLLKWIGIGASFAVFGKSPPEWGSLVNPPLCLWALVWYVGHCSIEGANQTGMTHWPHQSFAAIAGILSHWLPLVTPTRSTNFLMV